jgi:PHD/YefM family antitoxin component YafN of YafNO toxin-antitoxin module
MHEHPPLLRVAFAATWILLVAIGSLPAGVPAAAAARADEAEPMVREIYVPFEELDVLLEHQPERVLLSREEYEALIEKAKVVPETRAPRAVIVAAADYAATVEPERARLTGTLTLDVLEEGLHAVKLDLSGVGLRRAMLDGQSAAIGRTRNGPLQLFVEGKGRRELLLEMVAPVETTAATQVLSVRLPRPAAATLRLTVPGDVEVKSGADVARRVVDEAAELTRFELLPKQGDMTLVMTLNSRLMRRQRAVVARSVLVDEVTEAYERLHATVSMRVLHQAVDGFQFVVPDGFEVTEVDSPMLARWAVEEREGRRVLDVRLREQTTETVVLTLSAVRTAAPLDPWAFPRLEPLEVVGQVGVVGLLADERLRAEAIAAERLIPIDTAVLHDAIPETVFEVEPGAPTLRSVVAYYAPQSEFALEARFVKPPAEISVMTNVLLLLREQDQQARGEFFLTAKNEKLFGFDFSVPAGWHVTGVNTPDGKPLSFERYGPKDGPRRIYVRLPQGVPPGQEHRVYFNAESSPAEWLGKWESTSVEFPRFAVVGAVEDVGAIAVEAPDGEMELRLSAQENLVPLDAAERKQYGLAESDTSGRVLAYRYDTQPYRATLSVREVPPRLTAKTFSFLRIEAGALDAHYEIAYQVEEARTRELSLLLPAETPADLSIEALDGARLKQFTSSPADGMRRWTARLEEPAKGTVRLAVDFKQPLARRDEATADDGTRRVPATQEEVEDFALPIVRADGVAYQSGLAAVEGDSELEVQVHTDARRVDMGELSQARRQPGRGLLGVFGFVGEPPEVSVDVFRRPGYWLHPTIVERAELTTRLSAAGESVTVARFDLRTKAVYLEVELPAGAELWSADLDDKPLKPQREGDHLLVSVPAASGDGTRRVPATSEAVRVLRIVYQMPIRPVEMTGNVALPAPALRLRADRQTESVQVPMADLAWHLHPPPGYEVVRSDGTLVAEMEPPKPALLTVLRGVGELLFVSPLVWQAHLGADLGGPTLPSAAYLGDDVQYSEPSAEVRVARERYAGLAEADVEDEEEEMTGEQAGVALDVAVGEEPEAAMPAEAAPTAAPVRAFGRAVEERGEETRNSMGFILDPGMLPDAREGPAAAGAQPQAPEQPPGAVAEKPAPPLRRMPGVSSLEIRLEDAPRDGSQAVTFQSLGVEPELVVRLVQRPRFDLLAWGVGLVVALVGLALTNRRAAAKFRFVLLVVLVGSLVPLLPGWEETAGAANAAVYAACLLVPYYLLAGCVTWFVAMVRRGTKTHAVAATAAAVTVVLVAIESLPISAAEPAKRQAPGGPYVVQVIEPPEPVRVPEDAVILPYDAESETGIRDANQMLVPYAKYVELWNLAYPDQKIQIEKPPAAYGLAGASYTTRLEGDEYLLVEGRMEIDVYADEPVTVPLGLSGGVLARAELDGKPARLSVPQVVPNAQSQPQPAAQQRRQQAEQQVQQAVQGDPNPPGQSETEPGRSFVVLHVSGKGRHELQLAVRLRLERRGGWRVAEGALPSPAASSLAIAVPRPETDVRLGHVIDRQSYETEQADQTIETALGPNGAVSIQWRPKVGEGLTRRSLTVQSNAVLDVQEDGLRLTWGLTLQFPRSQRDAFRVHVPGDYLVERVEGTNVRGWEVRQEDGHQASVVRGSPDPARRAARSGDRPQPVAIEVSLLKTSRDSERFTIHLRRRVPVGEGEWTQFDAPVVTVPDAALHNGRLTIRRSPLLELRTTSKNGVTRTDLAADARDAAATPGDVDTQESPLGIRPYEAYEFAATPFAVRLEAAPLAGRVTATVHTVLKIAEFERSLESQVALIAEDRPIYRVEVFLPEELDLKEVSAPGQFQWALTRRDQPSVGAHRPLLSVYLATGQQGRVPVCIAGTLPRQEPTDPLPLPRLEVLGVDAQQGDVAVQVDPAFDVDAVGLERCEKMLRSRIYGWLNPAHRDVTALAIRYFRPDYQGTLRLSLRQPVVTCTTITNVRVTDRAIEETLLLDFTIQEAGIRQVEFLLPRGLQGCRVRVPMLRQKTIEPIDDGEDAPLRVHLVLQDDVMGELRVLVENDRELTPGPHGAPIPVVRTGRTTRQAVALQSAGRDEVVVDRSRLVGLEPLGRRQSRWQELRDVLGALTEAYLVTPGAEAPRLVFATKERKAVRTAGARIGLAETNLVFDPTGAYRAELIYRLDNATEQFLVIELPEGARLWTATVAGAPAKPTEAPGAKSARIVRIPLVKTAPGDLDYAVVLKYGGKLGAVGALDALRASIRFPLVRTRNIRVELSQVRLYLPETWRWFDFDGTMGLAGQEEELTAGFVSYQTKVVERLVETMRQDNPYAQSRAASNVKQLGQALHSYHSTWRRSQRSEQVRKEAARNAAVLERAEQQIEQLEDVAGDQLTLDNRFQLNTLFERQKTTRAKNVVQDLGSNWERPTSERTPPPEGAESAAKFNRRWLRGNYLITDADKKVEKADRLPSAGKKIQRLVEPKKAPAPTQQQQRFRGTRFQEGKGLPQGQPSRPGGEEDRVQEDRPAEAQPDSYEYGSVPVQREALRAAVEGLARRGGRRAGAVMADDSSSMVAGSGRAYGLVGPAPFEGEPGGPAQAGAGGAPAGPGAAPGVPAGLASLDVELPMRGVVYRFTTPGGDVEITARAVPGKLVRSLTRAAVIVAMLVVLLGIVRAARRGRFQWLTGRTGSWCLIVLGLVAFLFLPVIGLVALVSGIVLNVRRATAAKSTPAAAAEASSQQM